MDRRLAPALALAVTACGGDIPPSLERRIAADLSRQLGVPVDAVRCAGAACTATLAGAEVPLTLVDDGAEVTWEIAGFVIAAAPVEAQIALELDELGIEATADCGPRYRVTHVGERIPCALDLAGVPGAAWARVIDDAAHLDIELALDEAAAAARSAEIDRAELDRRSRALADDQPTPDGDDEGEGDGDGATAGNATPDAGATPLDAGVSSPR